MNSVDAAVHALLRARETGRPAIAADVPLADAEAAYAVQEGVAAALGGFSDGGPAHWKSGGASRESRPDARPVAVARRPCEPGRRYDLAARHARHRGRGRAAHRPRRGCGGRRRSRPRRRTCTGRRHVRVDRTGRVEMDGRARCAASGQARRHAVARRARPGRLGSIHDMRLVTTGLSCHHRRSADGRAAWKPCHGRPGIRAVRVASPCHSQPALGCGKAPSSPRAHGAACSMRLRAIS